MRAETKNTFLGIKVWRNKMLEPGTVIFLGRDPMSEPGQIPYRLGFVNTKDIVTAEGRPLVRDEINKARIKIDRRIPLLKTRLVWQ